MSESPHPATDLRPGDRVRIAAGAFATMTGTVTAVDPDRGVVTVEVPIYGRPVPVDLRPDQVEPDRG